jgi:hypothetical protein
METDRCALGEADLRKSSASRLDMERNVGFDVTRREENEGQDSDFTGGRSGPLEGVRKRRLGELDEAGLDGKASGLVQELSEP